MGGHHDPKRDSTVAWLSLLLHPVSFAGAFAVGEGLATALFDWPDTTDPAVWEVLAAGVPALVVFALPVVPAWFFGMRAYRNGSRSGRIAAWAAVGIGVLFAAMNGLAYLLG